MKHKLLPILLPVLFCLLGFAAGSSVSQLNLKQTKTQEGEKPKTVQPVKTKPSETPKSETGYETYTVLQGDTLFGISLKFNVSMDELSKLNSISDPNQVKAGQVLKIPKPGATTQESKTEIDLAKMQEIQNLVDQGQQPWRKDPTEVTKAEAPASFEFTALDTYTLKSKDLVKGEAVVEVKKVKDSKTYSYEVNLIQPVTKGEGGVWAVSLIKEVSG